MERMNGQVIFRKEAFAKTQPGTCWAKEEGEKGLQGLWFCHSHPIASPARCNRSSLGVNPDVRGATVPGREPGCVRGQQGMGNEGLPCLQLPAIQPTLTTSVPPRSAPGEAVWSRLCKLSSAQPWHGQPQAIPAPDHWSSSGSAVQDTLASLRKTLEV